jgi:hypothetical protein
MLKKTTKRWNRKSSQKEDKIRSKAVKSATSISAKSKNSEDFESSEFDDTESDFDDGNFQFTDRYDSDFDPDSQFYTYIMYSYNVVTVCVENYY